MRPPLRETTAAIDACIRQVADAYHRLAFVVGPAGAGKSAALAGASEQAGAPVVNVGQQLSRLMLEIPAHQRPRQARPLLDQVLDSAAGPHGNVLLDNTELLFDLSLQLDPLRLLQALSRHRTLVAAWTGTVANGTLRYAEPEHPEYRSYTVDGLLIVPVGTRTEP